MAGHESVEAKDVEERGSRQRTLRCDMRTELSTSMEAKAIREERQREKRVPPLFSLLCLRLSLESFSLSKVAHEGERMRLALFQGRNVCLGLLFQLFPLGHARERVRIVV